jgi:hypothetical protein
MSDAEKPILPSTEQPDLTQKKVIDTNAAPAGAGSPAEGATQKPWYQFWGGKRKSRKQSRKQKGGKKSKSRGGNKKSRKQKRSAKNKRA